MGKKKHKKQHQYRIPAHIVGKGSAEKAVAYIDGKQKYVVLVFLGSHMVKDKHHSKRAFKIEYGKAVTKRGHAHTVIRISNSSAGNSNPVWMTPWALHARTHITKKNAEKVIDRVYTVSNLWRNHGVYYMLDDFEDIRFPACLTPPEDYAEVHRLAVALDARISQAWRELELHEVMERVYRRLNPSKVKLPEYEYGYELRAEIRLGLV